MNFLANMNILQVELLNNQFLKLLKSNHLNNMKVKCTFQAMIFLLYKKNNMSLVYKQSEVKNNQSDNKEKAI